MRCRCCWRQGRWDRDERWRWAVVRGGLAPVCRGSGRDDAGVRNRMLMGAAWCAGVAHCDCALGEAGCATD